MNKQIECLIIVICFSVFCKAPQAVSQTISYFPTGEEFTGPLPTWKNIKSDFGAKGDGITDDALAITAALYTFKNLDNINSSVLYFPAGTYRLGSTILNAGRGEGGSEYAGFAIIGEDPSNTILLWDGPDDGTMFRLDGWYLKISRLTFDGQNKAKTGLLRDGYFGTGVEYSDLVFKNIFWGVRLGGDSGVGQAENLFLRCRFYNCNCGIYGPNMNSLDTWLWYCLFQDCSYGIHCGGYQAYGNVFLRSKVVDLGLSWQASCIVNNISVNTEFFNNYCDNVFFQGNEIYDPDTTKINWDNIPDTVKAFTLPANSVLLDNIIKTSGNSIAAIKLSSMFGKCLSAGNTFTQLWPIKPRNLVRDAQHSVRHAVDGLPQTFYIGEFWKIYYFNNPTVGIAWHCSSGTPRVAVKYSLTAANNWGLAPKSVRLVGSNDWGYNVTVLDTQENLSLTVGETKTLTFENTTPFAIYRLDILENNAGDTIITGGYFEVAEFSLTDTAGANLMNDQGGYVAGADEKWGKYYSVQEKKVQYDSITTPEVIELPGTPPLVSRRIFEVRKGMPDDATEIQRNIDSAATLPGGTRPIVHIPKGVYTINKTLILPAKVDMTLSGDGIFNGGTILSADPGLSGPTIRIAATSHLLVRDIVVGGNEAIYAEVDDQPGSRVTGAGFIVGGGNWLNLVNTAMIIDGIEQSYVLFSGITICDSYNGVLVRGGPVLSSGGSTNGQIAFLSGGIGGQNVLETQKNGKLIAQGMYYEGSMFNTKSFIDLTEASSGSLAISGMTWQVWYIDPDPGRPLVSIDNFQGQFTAMTNYFGPWDRSHWWRLTGDGSRGRILSACNEWYKGSDSAALMKWPYWFDQTSPSAAASRIFCEAPDITDKVMNTLPDTTSMLSSLDLMRSLRIKKPTAPLAEESHLDFIRVVAYGIPGTTAVRFMAVPDPYGRPGSPTLISPLNGSTDVTTNPSMNWNASTGASSYHLQVSTSTNFNPVVFEDSTISIPNQRIGSLINETAYYWRVLAKNSNGNSIWSPVWSFTTDTNTSIEQISTEIPGEFYLGNNYPNPFYLSTSIVYSIPLKAKVTLILFDTWGRKIATLVNEEQIAGKYEVKYNGSRLPGGIYFYRMQVGEYSETMKMVLIK